MTQSIYVSAIQRGSGKSTVALGLVSYLERTLNRVGYFKPIGQHCEGGVDPYARLTDKQKSTSIQVLFATDRARSDSEVPGERYAPRRGGCLLLGAATVQFKNKDDSWDALLYRAPTAWQNHVP